MNPHEQLKAQLKTQVNRRTFLRTGSLGGLGAFALAALADPSLFADDNPTKKTGVKVEAWPGAVQPLHFPQKAKRVIHLCMAGGPSHLETLDYKPKLVEMHKKPMPASFTKGQPIAQLQGKKLTCLGPQLKFKKWGKSGQSISEAFPHLGSVADEICIIRSMRTNAINHDPAHTFMNTGTTISGRPSMGSWLWYGLGADTDQLPGYVVLTSVGGGQNQPIASRQWHSGFLPSRFQGVHFHSKGDPVLYLSKPAGVTKQQQRDVVDAVEREYAFVGCAFELVLDGAGRRRQLDREGDRRTFDAQILDEAEVDDALLEIGVDDRAECVEYLARANGVGHGRKSSRVGAQKKEGAVDGVCDEAQ